MRFKEFRLNSILPLLNHLTYHRKLVNNLPIWFRGQSRENWELLPLLLRDGMNSKAEHAIVKRFKQNAFPILDEKPKEEWEWLMIMQHHGAPTRLLDWTESPLVAAYFAANQNTDAPGAIWALLPTILNKAANIDLDFVNEILGFGDDDYLNKYLPKSLLEDTVTDLMPVAAMAPRNTPRMQSQLGVFTISHKKSIPIESINDGNCVWLYIVEPDAKLNILQELETFSITRRTLFPELGPVGEETLGMLKS